MNKEMNAGFARLRELTQIAIVVQIKLELLKAKRYGQNIDDEVFEK